MDRGPGKAYEAEEEGDASLQKEQGANTVKEGKRGEKKRNNAEEMVLAGPGLSWRRLCTFHSFTYGPPSIHMWGEPSDPYPCLIIFQKEEKR